MHLIKCLLVIVRIRLLDSVEGRENFSLQKMIQLLVLVMKLTGGIVICVNLLLMLVGSINYGEGRLSDCGMYKYNDIER